MRNPTECYGFGLERWVDILDFNGHYQGYYQVSDFGRIKSLSRLIRHWRGGFLRLPERIMSPDRAEGYSIVILCRDGVRRDVVVHRLVASAFVPNPCGKPDVNHKDFNKGNNHYKNLEWVTKKENSRHAVDGGRMNQVGSGNGSAKLNEGMVLDILQRIAAGERQRALASEYNVSEALVCMIKKREIWRHVQFVS